MAVAGLLAVAAGFVAVLVGQAAAEPDVDPTDPRPAAAPAASTSDFIGPVVPTSPANPPTVPPIVIDPSQTIAPPDGGGGAGPGLPGGEGEDCSWYDIPCHINEWFQDLVIDALTPVLDLIADTTLTTPELAGMPSCGASPRGSRTRRSSSSSSPAARW